MNNYRPSRRYCAPKIEVRVDSPGMCIKPPEIKVYVDSSEECCSSRVVTAPPKPQSFFSIPEGFVDVKDEDFACVVCMENKKCCVLAPCSHVSFS